MHLRFIQPRAQCFTVDACNVHIHYVGKAGGGWALEFESFLGPVKWHRADRRMPFGAQKTQVIVNGGVVSG
jgi:hypothetical protein